MGRGLQAERPCPGHVLCLRQTWEAEEVPVLHRGHGLSCPGRRAACRLVYHRGGRPACLGRDDHPLYHGLEGLSCLPTSSRE